MGLGKQIRLNRLFAHPSARMCAVAVDHFIGYQNGLPAGLTDLAATLAKLVAGKPDAITMTKGTASNAWGPHAGKIPLIVSSVLFTADDALIERVAVPEEAVRLGADAIAVAIGVKGPNEGKFLKILCDTVAEAAPFDLPVISHIYPRDFSGTPRILNDHDNVMWAVRCGMECGADVIKVPFTGDAESFRQVIATSTVPVVAAGGPRCETTEEARQMIEKVVASGARGATIGRNIWGTPDPAATLETFKEIIHRLPPGDERA